MTIFRIALLVSVLLYVAVFSMKNTDTVVVDLVLLTLGPMPVALVVVTSIGLGALIAGLFLAPPYVKERFRHRRDTRRIEELEREVHGLRTLPLDPGHTES